MEIVKNKEENTKKNIPENIEENFEDFPKMEFTEFPVWDKNEKFVISGAQFEALFTYFNQFTGPVNVINHVFGEALRTGKITMKYIYPDGKEVPEEDVKAYREKVNTYFKEKMASQKPKIEVVKK